MSIYKRCPGCRKDIPRKRRKVSPKVSPSFPTKCPSCMTILGAKFKVKVKNPSTGKWRGCTVDGWKKAKRTEARLMVEMVPGVVASTQSQLQNLRNHQSLVEPQGTIETVSFDSYLEHAKLTKKTWKEDELRWNKHVAHRDYSNAKGIRSILLYMRDNLNLKPATIQHILQLIKRVYNWHIEEGLWTQPNPCRYIKLPKFDNRISNPLFIEDASNLVSYLQGIVFTGCSPEPYRYSHKGIPSENRLPNRKAAAVVLFALYTGRRRGEILGLQWDDVDFHLGTITCRNTKNGSTISFPINQKALSVLREVESMKGDSDGPVFGYGMNGFRSAWKRLLNRIVRYKIISKVIRFHDLRHTYASHLASSGKVDIYTLQRLMGHKDISLTERYAHLIDGHLRRSTEVLDDLYG